MDEQRVSALFQEAARDVPAPTFDAGDVTAESARLTRKRNNLVAGSALGFALLAGVLVTGVALWAGPNGSPGNDSGAMAASAAPERNETHAPYEVPSAAEDRAAGTPTDHPFSTPMQGGSTSGGAGSEPGGTPSGCGTAAREFAAALAGELPAATSAGDPLDSPVACPPGGRGVAIPVSDGPLKGLLSLVVVPADAEFALQPPWADRPSGTAGAVAVAGSGAKLVVVIEPVPGSAAPPIDAAGAREIADGLAAEF